MKKLIAVAALTLTLASCGGGDDAAEADAAVETADTDMPANSAGTYVGTGADGAEVTTVLAADGTFTDTLNGEVIRSGTWEDNVRGTCFTEEGVEGDMCYNMSTPAADGTVQVTGPDGTTTSMKKTA